MFLDQKSTIYQLCGCAKAVVASDARVEQTAQTKVKIAVGRNWRSIQQIYSPRWNTNWTTKTQNMLGLRPASRILPRSLKPSGLQSWRTISRLGVRNIQQDVRQSYRDLWQQQRPVKLISFANYSTKTAPPPPPPPPKDKNARGKALLSRISRFFTFSVASGIVVGAVAISGLVIYLILSELFLPSGDTRTFNKALKIVEESENAQKALGFGPQDRLTAYGEVPGDKWVRNRPAQGIKTRGADGKDRMVMRFHVESPSGKHASVILEQVDKLFWTSEFHYIALELPNKKLVYVIEPPFSAKNFSPRGFGKGNGFLGLNWGPKKD